MDEKTFEDVWRETWFNILYLYILYIYSFVPILWDQEMNRKKKKHIAFFLSFWNHGYLLRTLEMIFKYRYHWSYSVYTYISLWQASHFRSEGVCFSPSLRYTRLRLLESWFILVVIDCIIGCIIFTKLFPMGKMLEPFFGLVVYLQDFNWPVLGDEQMS